MKRWQTNIIFPAAILLWTIGPILCAATAGWVAGFFGARVDAAGPLPCLIAGHDVGGWIYALSAMGWLIAVTVPTGVVAMGVFLVLARMDWRALHEKEAARERRLAKWRETEPRR